MGDAVIGLAVAWEVYTSYPLFAPGDLSQIRDRVVNKTALADVAADIGLCEAINKKHPKLCADLFEAYIGQVYASQGAASALSVARNLLSPRIVPVVRDMFGKDPRFALMNKMPGNYEVGFCRFPNGRVEARMIMPDGKPVSSVGASKKDALRQVVRGALRL